MDDRRWTIIMHSAWSIVYRLSSLNLKEHPWRPQPARATRRCITTLGALGVAALADILGEGRNSPWSRPLFGLLDVLGVNALTSQLGAAAGAPRAIMLGALVLTLVLALTAPLFLRAGTAAPAQ